MKYPRNWMSLVTMWGAPMGTRSPNLWISWMTESVYGILVRSSRTGSRCEPITWSISLWILSAQKSGTRKPHLKRHFSRDTAFYGPRSLEKKTILKGYMIDIPQSNQLGVVEAKEEARKIPTLMFNECYGFSPHVHKWTHTQTHTTHAQFSIEFQIKISRLKKM